MEEDQDFLTLRSRRPGSSADSTYGSASETSPLATHDISRVSYHVKHLESFAEALQDSASRAFPNRGRSVQRYSNVQALMLHWRCDDLFVLPELEDLEKCLREDYHFETDIFAIPSENAHLELMLKIGDMVKKHESEDTLFVIYYGGHARIDESRQSTWCATRHPGSPWLQWSAIQTLLERSMSDVLIFLDCCAGAASATFPTGKSITETISASSWDAIAPDPGRYSFTNALIEVLQEWRARIFSAAMLHAEVLARLKHPRPIMINGKNFEARSTPVHFMMTSNHKAPSIEIGRVVPRTRSAPSPPKELPYRQLPASRSSLSQDGTPSLDLIPNAPEPNEDQPHVMISLALEDDQRLDINAWEQWLGSFPALAKFVKVQGVFKSHSTLLLLSLPVMVWDLLPDDPACSFVAFIRSNNLIKGPDTGSATPTSAVLAENQVRTRADTQSWMSGTTYSPADDSSATGYAILPARPHLNRNQSWGSTRPSLSGSIPSGPNRPAPAIPANPGPNLAPQSSFTSLATQRSMASTTSLSAPQRQPSTHRTTPGGNDGTHPFNETILRTTILNQSKNSMKTTFSPDHNVPEGPPLSQHVVKRLEGYFQRDPEPTVAWIEVLASNVGVETSDLHLWFHHRREQDRMTHNLQSLGQGSKAPEIRDGVQMILPGHLNTLLEIFPSKSVLIVDLRSATDFDKSHIHDAVNLRAPLSFVQNTSLEMIEDTFMDDQSRRIFSKWSQYQCVVFYDRVVEFDWECPVAEALYRTFRGKAWLGQCFILKGHYREFSASFDKYISGSKMSKEAKEYLDGLRQQSSLTQEEANRRRRRYDEWLRIVTMEDRVPQRVELIPARKLDRRHAVDQHQKELETEFEARFPALYKKAQAMGPRAHSPPPPPRSPSPPPPFEGWQNSEINRGANPNQPFRDVNWGEGADDDETYGGETYGGDTYGGQTYDGGTYGGETYGGETYGGETHAAEGRKVVDDDFGDRKAALVQPFMSGLEKIRGTGAGYSAGSGGGGGGDGHIPMIEQDYLADKLDLYSDEYEEIDPKSEGLKNDPAFQRAGGRPQDLAGGGSSAGGGGSGEDGVKKGGKVANLKRPHVLWDRIRSGK